MTLSEKQKHLQFMEDQWKLAAKHRRWLRETVTHWQLRNDRQKAEFWKSQLFLHHKYMKLWKKQVKFWKKEVENETAANRT